VRTRLALLAVPLALALAGCGGEKIDGVEIQDKIAVELEHSTGKKITAIKCPTGVDADAGTKFECSMKFDGKPKTAKVEVTDGANLRLLNSSEFE
jgi:hypothetical protein